MFAKLLAKLDVPEMGGSTYLDNSLVYWGNELGFNHIAYSVPCMLAGGAGGFIKPGRYIDYIDWDGRAYFSQENGNVIKGIPHNQFLVTALQAMGLAPADYETGGKAGYGSTSVNSRTSDTWAVDYDLSTVGQILPGIQRLSNPTREPARRRRGPRRARGGRARRSRRRADASRTTSAPGSARPARGIRSRPRG